MKQNQFLQHSKTIIGDSLKGAKMVTILSGGLDSTTLVYYLNSLGADQHLLSFNYGQRHSKELRFASETADRLGLFWSAVDLRSVGDLFTGSSLTDKSVEVPEGHYAAETMKATIVPNRNAIMLSIAWGVAVADKAVAVAYGAHAGDHAIYPDCREGFVQQLTRAFQAADDSLNLMSGALASDARTIHRPFIGISKAEIVGLGLALGVPFEHTWTCYKGGEVACGRCGTCVERLEAFAEARATDPLPYLDSEFWRTAK